MLLELFENLWDKKQAKGLITLFILRVTKKKLAISLKFTDDYNINDRKFSKEIPDADSPKWEICSSLLLMKEYKSLRTKFNIEKLSGT
jgi:hypothetical protein